MSKRVFRDESWNEFRSVQGLPENALCTCGCSLSRHGCWMGRIYCRFVQETWTTGYSCGIDQKDPCPSNCQTFALANNLDFVSWSNNLRFQGGLFKKLSVYFRRKKLLNYVNNEYPKIK